MLRITTMFPSRVLAHMEVNQVLNSLVEDSRYAQFEDNPETLGKTIGQHMLVVMKMKKLVTFMINNYLNCYSINEEIRLYLINFI